MAETTYTASSATTKKLWHEKLFRDTVKESYFAPFMGKDKDDLNSLITVARDLEKDQGERIRFTIRMRLTGAGQTGDNTVEGNEEDLTTYTTDLNLEQYRHGVKTHGKKSDKITHFDVPKQARMAIQDWGTEKIDSLMFTALQNSPTKIFYPSTATAVDELTTSMKLDTLVISRAKAWGLTGWNRAQTPLRPLKVNGKKYFILLVHPDQMYDLINDSAFAQARREAEVRGPENPIFTGAKAIWNGVVIHEHENIDIALTGGVGGDVPYATSVLMGAQSLLWAWGMRPGIVEDSFDYKNKTGYAWHMIAATAKPVFNSLDHGSVAIYTARTQISDAT